jgi:hypothetical protein
MKRILLAHWRGNCAWMVCGRTRRQRAWGYFADTAITMVTRRSVTAVARHSVGARCMLYSEGAGLTRMSPTFEIACTSNSRPAVTARCRAWISEEEYRRVG